MSQEQPPIRSRRELRQARDAQQAAASQRTDQVQPAPPEPQTPPAPATEPTHTQRSSQIRARDRAALRTIKELEEKEGQLSAGGPPTRRQLRLQQLKEQALTAATPVVPTATPQPKVAPAPTQPARPARPEAAGTAAGPSAPDGMTVEQALAARALIAEQARNQIAKMEHIASLDPEAVDPDILAEQIALAERAAVLNRRAIARQKLAEQAGGPATGKDAPDDATKTGIPAAPGAALPPKKSKENRGTPATGGERSGPATASNLAMVTPLEFVQVPGVDRPVMKPPATSHVPVTTRPGTRVATAAGTKRRPASRSGAAADTVPGRSQVIARAEAAARAAKRPKPLVLPENQPGDLAEGAPRVPASSAYGLDPLDAATAGLARARRNTIMQVCILALGVVALVSGVALIISGLA
jgi:hypothetical protein